MSRNAYFIIFGIALLLYLGFLYDHYGTDIFPKTESVVPEKKQKMRDGLVKKFDDYGKLRTAVNYKDGIKEGSSFMYYRDGKTVQLEMPYASGKRQGTSKKFFENGKIYAETNYLNDKIHGIRKVYYQSGKVKSEIPYGFGYPGMGLKEYLRDGQLKELPSIVFKQSDTEENKIIMSLSKTCKNPRFYIGKLIEDQYFNELDEKIKLLAQNDNRFYLDLNVYAPSYLKLQDVVCSCESTQGNAIVLKQRIDISSLKKVN